MHNGNPCTIYSVRWLTSNSCGVLKKCVTWRSIYHKRWITATYTSSFHHRLNLWRSMEGADQSLQHPKIDGIHAIELAHSTSDDYFRILQCFEKASWCHEGMFIEIQNLSNQYRNLGSHRITYFIKEAQQDNTCFIRINLSFTSWNAAIDTFLVLGSNS